MFFLGACVLPCTIVRASFCSGLTVLCGPAGGVGLSVVSVAGARGEYCGVLWDAGRIVLYRAGGVLQVGTGATAARFTTCVTQGRAATPFWTWGGISIEGTLFAGHQEGDYVRVVLNQGT